jgi:uncharacterized membrane protein
MKTISDRIELLLVGGLLGAIPTLLIIGDTPILLMVLEIFAWFILLLYFILVTRNYKKPIPKGFTSWSNDASL